MARTKRFLILAKHSSTIRHGIFFHLFNEQSWKCVLGARHCFRYLFSVCDSEANYELVDSEENKPKSNTDCLKFSLARSRKSMDSFIRVCRGLSRGPACSPLALVSAPGVFWDHPLSKSTLPGHFPFPSVAPFLTLCGFLTDVCAYLPPSVCLLRPCCEEGRCFTGLGLFFLAVRLVSQWPLLPFLFIRFPDDGNSRGTADRVNKRIRLHCNSLCESTWIFVNDNYM